MESNRDDAERCQQLGSEAIAGGDFQRAVKYFGKAQRLFPTSEGAAQLAQAEEELEKQNPQERGGEDASRSTDASSASPFAGAHRRPRASGGAAAEDPRSGEGPVATAEQVELVRRIRRCKDYYEILELAKSSTDDEVKKAYRKLSLKVHPDKNKAPGAEDAFKAVSKAFQCLSDRRLRSNYDTTGHEDPQQALREQRHGARQRYHQGGGPRSFYDNDAFDPNDIFNAFFGTQGVHGNGRVFRAHFGQPSRPQASAGPRSMGPSLLGLLQLLPLLAIFLYALLPPAEPHYRLQRIAPHLLERTTGAGVNYFVKSDEFDQQFPVGSRQRRKLEMGVEAEYRDSLETRCYYERVQQAQLYRWGDAKKAREMNFPSCDELRRLQRVR